MMVDECEVLTDHSRHAGMNRHDLALPPRLQQIPKRFELLRIDEVFVVRDAAALDAALEQENILIILIDVLVFAAPPFGLVQYFRQDERGRNRIQLLIAIKQLVGAVHAAGVNIRDIFSGSPFLHESRSDLGAAANDERELDLWIGFLKKIPENVLEDRRAVDGEPSLFPGCLYQLFPIVLPVRLRRRFRRKDKEKNDATEDGCDFHFFSHTLIDESRLQGSQNKSWKSRRKSFGHRSLIFGGSYDFGFARQRSRPT